MNSPVDPDNARGAEPDETVSLLFETSPYGNIDAIIEHDGRAVYFYLNGPDPFGTRACWVRNLAPGPYVINKDELQEGIPPMLPRTHCTYSDSRPIPNTDDLSIVWFEEGNGAALLELDSVLAVIPPWSGMEGFHGYARDCAAESQVCWPIPDNPQLRLRIDRAQAFWTEFESSENNPFVDLQRNTLQHYQSRFGKESAYYSIDSGTFPPRGLARYHQGNRITMATVGMSLCPQPVVELYVDQPGSLRRVELALQIDLGDQPLDPESLQPLLQQLSGIAAMPWREWTWLGPGHTCGLSRVADILGADFQHVAMVSDKKVHPMIENRIQFRGDTVNLLWMIPITTMEQQQLGSGEVSLEDLIDDTRMPESG